MAHLGPLDGSETCNEAIKSEVPRGPPRVAGTAEDSECSEREHAKGDTRSDPNLSARLHVLVGRRAGRAGAGAGRGDASGTLHRRCPDGKQTA